jgi:dimethylargininase
MSITSSSGWPNSQLRSGDPDHLYHSQVPGPIALVRPVPDCFDRALVREGAPVIDTDVARAQHLEYCRHLAGAGYQVQIVPADEAHPDCVFIEDTAVVIGDTALITRPGAVGRRGEIEPVAEALSRYFRTTRVVAPGTIDGGDVLVVGGMVYVGRSQRTNEAGIEQLRAVAAEERLETTVVAVHDALHLKSAALPIDEGTLVVTRDAVDEHAFNGLHILYEADEERHRFSALPLRDGRVMVTASAPVTSSLVARAGHETVAIDVSQIQAADGGLTCMSILL